MRFLFKSLAKAIQKICYPSICVYCHKLCDDKRHIFCTECFYLIDILDQEERCFTCFSLSEELYCLSCKYKPNIKQVYVSEKQGPIDALLQKVLQGQHYRIPAIAALMAYQYVRLHLPFPDYIVPVSRKKLAVLLTKEIGKILQVPYRRIFLKEQTHILLAGFQIDQNYNRVIEKLQKIHPKTLIGVALVGPSGF